MRGQTGVLRQVFARAARDLLRRGETSVPSGPGLVSRRSYYSRGEIPSDPSRQPGALRQLNQAGRHDAVVASFEAGHVVCNEGTLGEYVRALVALDRLDHSSLLSTLSRGATAGATAGAQAAPPAAAAAAMRDAMARGDVASMSMAGGAGGMGMSGGAAPGMAAMASTPASEALGGAAPAVAAGGQALGTAKDPLVIMQAEPSLWTQLWRTIRTLGLAFIFFSGAGALMEERGGFPRSILNNPDLKPQMGTTTRFADVKGVDEAKGELEEVVQYLRDPAKFTSLGGKLPKGVLLVGPPGTGKTMLARAIAGEAGVPFFYCSGSEFEEMFVGVGARRVRELFASAKKTAPCIIFIDEIDAIGGSRNPKDQMYMKMTLNQLLVELDGFRPSEGVIVVAATNFPESLDKALVRPGRFDRHVVVPNPDVKGRAEILASHFKSIPKAADVDLQVIARGTSGFSGADLANLVNIAALKAARDNESAVTMHSLEYAKDRIMMGAERKSAVISAKNRRLTAYHEGGHAIVALLTDGALPVHKATIVPRGMALGMVMQLPEADDTSVSRRQLLAKLDVCMGGRVAEELVFGAGNVTTGASSDLEQATRLARAMVTRYGMSEAVGKISVNYDDDGRSLSTDTRTLIEQEVRTLLNDAYERAKTILAKHKDKLDVLAAELLEKETLSGAEIRELLKVPAPKEDPDSQPTAVAA